MSSAIASVQRVLHRIQTAITLKRNPAGYARNRARRTVRQRVLGCLHL